MIDFKNLPTELPENPEGWRQSMVSHINMGRSGHVGTYAIFDERGREMPIQLGYRSGKDPYRGFFFYGDNDCLTWRELRERWPTYVKSQRRLIAAGRDPLKFVGTAILVMYVVYEGAKDLPPGFAVRRWNLFPNGRAAHDGLLGQGLADVEAARALLPEGLINIGREDGDDPVIAEVWL